MLYIRAENVRILEFIVLNTLPTLKDNIKNTILKPIAFRQIRQFSPSILNDFPSLRVVTFHDGISLAFPPDDSANASDGQAVAKWLFTPRADNLWKVLSIVNSTMEQWLTNVEQIKAAFSDASSPVSFVIYIEFPPPFPTDSIASFKRTNELTREQLTLSPFEEEANVLQLMRCSCEEGSEEKWQKALKELFCFHPQNQIDIWIGDDECDDGLIGASSAGPSGDQKEQKK